MCWKKKAKRVVEIQERCKMPSLSGIDNPLMNRLIVRLLVPETGISRKAELYRTIFVRLIDKAIREYDLSREAYISDIVEERQQLRFLEFTDHIETCINAISRLFSLLDRLKTERESPEFPREIRRLVERSSDSITAIRNSVEHMDEMIRKDEITPDNPIAINYSSDRNGIIIADCEMSFRDLAIVLEKMNEIAQYILRIKNT